jgi:hypothetical protein
LLAFSGLSPSLHMRGPSLLVRISCAIEFIQWKRYHLRPGQLRGCS